MVLPDSRPRFLSICVLAGWLFLGTDSLVCAASVSALVEGERGGATAKALRLSLNDALALFIKQNLDVLIAKFGIESSR